MVPRLANGQGSTYINTFQCENMAVLVNVYQLSIKSNQINIYDFWLIGNILLWFSSRAATISWMLITVLFKLTTEIKVSYQLNPTH